jgi:hypothetical protein
MEEILRKALNSQYAAALKMLENTITQCPLDLWQGRLYQERQLRPEFAEFWYIVSHVLFWTDLYLTGSYEGFTPPLPFTLVEMDPAGVLPDRVYTQHQLLIYLDHCQKKSRECISALTEESVARVCHLVWGDVSYLELLLDTLRHIQEHAAQLNLYLGQARGNPSRWVSLDQ